MIILLRSTPFAFVDLGNFLSAPEASGSARKLASPHRFVSGSLQTAATLIGRDAACRVSTRKHPRAAFRREAHVWQDRRSPGELIPKALIRESFQ